VVFDRGLVTLRQLPLGRLQEALGRCKSRNNTLDDKSARVSDGSLWPLNIQSDAHAVTILERLENIHAGQAALANLVGDFLVLQAQLFHVELLDERLNLILKLAV